MTDRYRTIVPAPRRAESAEGSFELGPETRLFAAPGAEAAADAARLLLAPLRLPLAPADAAGDGVVEVRIDPAVEEAEGYRLAVTPRRVEIAGADLAGVRHAVQVLRQLLGADAFRAVAPRTVRRVPAGTVEDAPVLGWRGGMLDVSRHFMTKRTLLRYVDLLAMHRMNVLHLHLTDDQGWRIESRRYPEINRLATHRTETMAGRFRKEPTFDGTPHGGYYTLDDLSEVAAYAAERGVTIVPEIDLPGHASALITVFPELGTGGGQGVLRGWGISAGILKPIPAAVKLVTELIDEVLEAVDSPYFHMGGDECVMKDWPTDPDTSAHMAVIGAEKASDLHGWFLREIGTYLAGRGRRMVVWDEAFQTGGVVDDTIVMCWRGDAIAKEAAAAGHDVVRSPVYPTYLDYDQAEAGEQLAIGGPITLEDSAGFAPLRDDWSEAERAHVIGGQWQAWSEYIPHERHLDYMVFPRACAIAEASWSGRPTDHGDLTRRLSEAHLARLDAAGCEYRPLDGPRPWQAGGTGARAHVDSHRSSREQWAAYTDAVPDSGESHAETTG